MSRKRTHNPLTKGYNGKGRPPERVNITSGVKKASTKTSNPTYSYKDILDNISEVLAEMPGEEVARIHNKICSNQIRYKGDSMYEDDMSEEEEEDE